MGTNQAFLIVLILVIIGFIVLLLVMAKLGERDKQFYDKRWKIYNPENTETEEKGKKGKK